jgi:hypothetical protein
MYHDVVYINVPTWLVSAGSHISNNLNNAHSTPPILCFWSALLEEKVCTVMPGQSGRRSKSRSRRFVTKSLTSEGGCGFEECVGLAVVLIDKLRERPVVAVPATAVVLDVVRDIGGPNGKTWANDRVVQRVRTATGDLYRLVVWCLTLEQRGSKQSYRVWRLVRQ